MLADRGSRGHPAQGPGGAQSSGAGQRRRRPLRGGNRAGQLGVYLDLCADVGFDGIECGAGFTNPCISPAEVVRLATENGLGVQYELGKKHDGEFAPEVLTQLIDEGRRWLDAGASRLIIEARESAAEVGLFDRLGSLNGELAERLARVFGLSCLIFEAPTKSSQFALLDHFGPQVQLSNVPLQELLRVEIYRRGLHSDAFANPKLGPVAPASAD